MRMLKVSPEAYVAMSRAAAGRYVSNLLGWLGSLPEVDRQATRADAAWCHAQIELARAYGIESEDAVARFARLRLLRDDEWFSSSAAQDILVSGRDGNLKCFQLECLDRNLRDG